MPSLRLPAWMGLCFISLVGLSGCVREAPFPMLDYRYHQRGLIKVCYDPAHYHRADAQAIAEPLCRQVSRRAEFQSEQENQCSWSSPMLVTYVCVSQPGEVLPPLQQRNNPLRRDNYVPIK